MTQKMVRAWVLQAQALVLLGPSHEIPTGLQCTERTEGVPMYAQTRSQVPPEYADRQAQSCEVWTCSC